ncbi:hypothetical protein AU468_11120 [Alkalispirochaeta sphaeroplastigenens]|uniref:Outer membrane protein beta-barrel domain-containing protein n=1 Tax=Alkalispirochaeta sphaeroplastigenens TaxID=1187066 RepID=A0A2S4JHP0_9SPIO|nr:hypothetical protein [Alkalispirochaeta sphaeroplastigenens]POQ98940.1 hypothetical protein AU468_11120 [Alkalispirochaeta sphaeroplastigenens]
MKKLILIATMACLLAGIEGRVLSADPFGSRQEIPEVQGWSLGIGLSDLYGTHGHGGKLGFWGNHAGFEASFYSSALFLNMEYPNGSTDGRDRTVSHIMVGFKLGTQVDRSKWYGLFSVGGLMEVIEDDGGEETLTTEISVVSLGGGVDFAITPNLLVGIDVLNLRYYAGDVTHEFYGSHGSGWESRSLTLEGMQVSFFGGGHISYQF